MDDRRLRYGCRAGGFHRDALGPLPRSGHDPVCRAAALRAFRLALPSSARAGARAGVVKDAGDDPDVTHGALVIAETAWAAPGSGIGFAAGEGVGTVTRAGLPLAVGEPAINPAPRAMICDALLDAAAEHGAAAPDLPVTISIPGGERLAEKTMNARLGIVGGLSILGTTGIVVPYSCASWIHAIHRGIDVARAAGLDHIAAATGATSERAVQRLYGLPDHALIDMGDFVGGTLKYLRAHPVERLTIAGGFAKLAKLAAGHLDLHSARSRVDITGLCGMLAECGAEPAALQNAEAAAGAAEILAWPADKRERWPAWLQRKRARWRLRHCAARRAIEVAIVDRQGGVSCSGRGMAAQRLLILGGTAEAAALARGTCARFGDALEVTTSLAGRTRSPAPSPGASPHRRLWRPGAGSPPISRSTRSTG